MSENNNLLGKRLKELRKELKLTQEDIAKKIGITKSAYGFYEQGKTVPDAYTLSKLSNIFDVSTDFLLGRTIARNYVDTIAFHSLDDDDLTEEGKEELAKLKELLKLKYAKKD